MKPPTFEALKKLQEEVNALCDKAFDERENFRSSINWGDLECVTVEWFMNAEMQHGYNIYIEEAALLTEDLKQFILDGLLEYAADGVIRVITEW